MHGTHNVTLQIVYKSPCKSQPEDGCMKSQTCRCCYLLIIFYILKLVLDYKIIYILLITIENRTGMLDL